MRHAAIPHVKGSALTYWVAWYVEHHGAGALMAVAAQIPPEERGDLDPSSPSLGLIPTDWYPSSAVGRLLDGITEGMSDEERAALIRESTAAGVQQAIRGIFQLAFGLLATPERYARYIQRFWSQLHDTGRRRIDLVGPGEASSIIEDWPGHHPILCSVTMETMAAVFRRMGLQEVEVERVECVSEGHPRCRAHVRWRP